MNHDDICTYGVTVIAFVAMLKYYVLAATMTGAFVYLQRVAYFPCLSAYFLIQWNCTTLGQPNMLNKLST